METDSTGPAVINVFVLERIWVLVRNWNFPVIDKFNLCKNDNIWAIFKTYITTVNTTNTWVSVDNKLFGTKKFVY